MPSIIELYFFVLGSNCNYGAWCNMMPERKGFNIIEGNKGCPSHSHQILMYLVYRPIHHSVVSSHPSCQDGALSPRFLIYHVQTSELAMKKWKFLCIFPYTTHGGLQYTENSFWLNHSCLIEYLHCEWPNFQVTLFMASFYDFPGDTSWEG